MKTDSSCTRREFLRHASGAAFAAATLPTALAAADAPKLPWKFCAFNKPVQFLDYAETAEFFAALGFDGIEVAVRPGGHVLPERVEEDLPKLVAALKPRGLEVTLITTAIGGVGEPHAEKVLRTAAKLGLQRYRMTWYDYDYKRPILPQLEALQPRLKELAALNRSLGLTGLYQNHAGAGRVGALVWDVFELLREHDPRELALAFDIRHATVEAGQSWITLFHLVKAHIGVAYFKDFAWEKDKALNVPLGEGRVNRKYAALLKAGGFTGPMSLHVEYGEGRDKKVFAEAFRRDLATLRQWLA